jgi:Leucine-rich repeat (LRR) protein
LKKIYFNKSQLSEIPDDLFDNCLDLEWIDFSDNRLSKIPNRLLANCRALNNIDFSNNQLSIKKHEWLFVLIIDMELHTALLNLPTLVFTFSRSMQSKCNADEKIDYDNGKELWS